jgi:hypothetical protein
VQTTKVPDLVDRIIELLQGATDSETTQVLDGPTVSGNYKDLVFLVGYRPDQQDDIRVTRTGPNGLTHHDHEYFELGVLINAVDATGNVKAARDKAASALAILEQILTANDMGLGLGPGVQARLSDQAWRVFPSTKGVEQTVSCVVVGQALL